MTSGERPAWVSASPPQQPWLVAIAANVSCRREARRGMGIDRSGLWSLKSEVWTLSPTVVGTLAIFRADIAHVAIVS